MERALVGLVVGSLISGVVTIEWVWGQGLGDGLHWRTVDAMRIEEFVVRVIEWLMSW